MFIIRAARRLWRWWLRTGIWCSAGNHTENAYHPDSGPCTRCGRRI